MGSSGIWVAYWLLQHVALWGVVHFLRLGGLLLIASYIICIEGVLIRYYLFVHCSVVRVALIPAVAVKTANSGRPRCHGISGGPCIGLCRSTDPRHFGRRLPTTWNLQTHSLPGQAPRFCTLARRPRTRLTSIHPYLQTSWSWSSTRQDFSSSGCVYASHQTSTHPPRLDKSRVDFLLNQQPHVHECRAVLYRTHLRALVKIHFVARRPHIQASKIYVL